MKNLALLACLCACTNIAVAAIVEVKNSGFTVENTRVAGWKLSGGSGRGDSEKGNDFVSVSGSGEDSSFWQSDALDFQPNATYRLQFRARNMSASGGTPVTGPVFANRDLGGLGGDWRTFTTNFQTPRELTPDNNWLRFGQWHVKGAIAFDDIKLATAQPVYARSGAIQLGDGETAKGNEYSCRAPLGGEANNTSRALLSHNCSFNSDRWVFGSGSEVIYRHEIAGRKQTAAQIEVGVTWYSGGALAVDVSRDGQSWTPLGTQDKLGALSLTIPAELLPANAIFVRLRAAAKAKVGANSDPGSFQVGQYRFHSTFDGALLNLHGSTRFFAVEKESPDLRVKILDGGNGVPGGRNYLILEVERGPQSPKQVKISFADPAGLQASNIEHGGKEAQILALILGFGTQNLILGTQRVEVPYNVGRVGEQSLHLYIADGKHTLFTAGTTWNVPELYAANYGETLPTSTIYNNLWWCSSGWKISQTRPAPGKTGVALKMSAARNESEAAQFVLRPLSGLKNLTVEAPPLRSTNATIDAKNLEILRVRYVDIAQPTDATGTAAPWPDPLPSLSAPLNLAPNINQPFWVRVRVPKDAKPGVYQGSIRLHADGYNATVPVQLTVWNFALPDSLTCQTAFGFSPGTVYRYQKLDDPAQRRQVMDLYLKNFSAHHVSPYDPAPLDPIKVTWQGGSSWQDGQRVDEAAHGGKRALLVEDNSPTQQFSARYAVPIAIPKAGLKLSFWYRTQGAARSIVTLNHNDAGGQWMSGRNNDMKFEGDGTWQHFERVITQFPAGAKSVALTLWAAPYTEDGSMTGIVTFDDVSLIDLDSGKELLEDGGFESINATAPRPVFDWTAWDAAMEKAIHHYGFNSFRLPLQGLGGGTFESREEPELAGFRENTPEYQAALKAYLQGIEAHLRAKGWLDKAYVYWFDEPDPKDYAFVMNGFAKLKQYAPGLQRMLTEQPENGLVGGPNLWCPVSPEFKQSVADERTKAGDKFWWYVCTVPKAPYATEFIDHPATEMRGWLWQTWQRGIKGVLVWETAYWTSDSAYPNAPQNPYADPMSWVSGYSTAKGTKQPWGNGDGRFIYPPEAAADANPQAPIIAGPVDSIRWELLRDGLEDYEYLAMLRRLLGTKKVPAPRRAALEKLLVVPDNITRDATTFTRDPAPIESRRAELAAAIEGLQ